MGGRREEEDGGNYGNKAKELKRSKRSIHYKSETSLKCNLANELVHILKQQSYFR